MSNGVVVHALPMLVKGLQRIMAKPKNDPSIHPIGGRDAAHPCFQCLQNHVMYRHMTQHKTRASAHQVRLVAFPWSGASGKPHAGRKLVQHKMACHARDQHPQNVHQHLFQAQTRAHKPDQHSFAL